MKKCKFCGQTVDIDQKCCDSCGGNAFKFVCNNCGNEFEDGFHCPRCGVKVFQKEKICPKCNNHYYTKACPECGYTDLNTGLVQQESYTSLYNSPPPQYSSSYQQYSPPPAQYSYTPPQYQSYQTGYGQKDKTVALILCIFFGFFGAHKFYENKPGIGILYFFTAGLFGIGWFIDIIALLSKPPKYYP